MKKKLCETEVTPRNKSSANLPPITVQFDSVIKESNNADVNTRIAKIAAAQKFADNRLAQLKRPSKDASKYKKPPPSIFSDEYLEKHMGDGLSEQIIAFKNSQAGSQQHQTLGTEGSLTIGSSF